MNRNEILDYRFHYVTYNELNDLEHRHPLVYQSSTPSLLEILKDCPDIFDDFPIFFYLEQDNTITCSCVSYPDRFSWGEKNYPWSWAVLLSTHPSYRGKGLATILLKKAIKLLHQKGIAWGAIFGTPVSIHTFRKIGTDFPGYAGRHVMLKTLRPFLEAHLKLKPLAYVLDILSRPFLRWALKLLSCPRRLKPLEAKVEEISLDKEKFTPASFPPLEYQSPFHFNDNPSKHYWKIKKSNLKEENTSSLYILKEIPQNEPLSYFILRRKLQTEPVANKYRDFISMTLMDFGLYKNDARIYPTLLNSVIQAFWKSDADVLQIVSSSEKFCSYMKRVGMRKAGKGVSFNFSLPKEWDLGRGIQNLDNWHLTHFTGDTFAF